MLTKEERLHKFITEHPDSNVAKAVQVKVTLAKKQAEENAKREFLVQARLTEQEERSKTLREAKLEKWSKIIEMRIDEKLTLQQIGDRLTPKITRERVRQILKEISLKTGATFPSSVVHEQTTMTTHCKFCNAEVLIRTCFFKAHGKHNCKLHQNRQKYSTAEEALNAHLKLQRTRYQTDPDFRSRHAKSVKKWYLKVKNDPEFKRKRAEYIKNYHSKKKIMS